MSGHSGGSPFPRIGSWRRSFKTVEKPAVAPFTINNRRGRVDDLPEDRAYGSIRNDGVHASSPSMSARKSMAVPHHYGSATRNEGISSSSPLANMRKSIANYNFGQTPCQNDGSMSSSSPSMSTRKCLSPNNITHVQAIMEEGLSSSYSPPVTSMRKTLNNYSTFCGQETKSDSSSPSMTFRKSMPYNNYHGYEAKIESLSPSPSISVRESMEYNNYGIAAKSRIASENSTLHSLPASRRTTEPTATIMVAPGLRVRLRGTAETLEAIDQNNYVMNECFCCQASIFCIRDAAYVICPDCRSFSPTVSVNSKFADGVGLGFKVEDIINHQQQKVGRCY